MYDDARYGYYADDLAKMRTCDAISAHQFGVEVMAPDLSNGVHWGQVRALANSYFMELYTSGETSGSFYLGGSGIVNGTLSSSWSASARSYAPMVNVGARIDYDQYDDDVGNQLAAYCRATTNSGVGVYAGVALDVGRITWLFRGMNACTTS